MMQSPELERLRGEVPRQALLAAVREALDWIRQTILQGGEQELCDAAPDRAAWARRIREEAERTLTPSLRRVINGTGVIVHTNLGRSLLAKEAVSAVVEAASRYSSLEYDLEAGRRGSRFSHVEGILRRLTGAEAATAVNNNAGAVLIALNALARGKEVVVSRGELVEIGGSFRMPDVMAQSGANLVEVGTTNKTRLKDYEAAIGPETALLLKVHTSNYRIVGFTEEVSLEPLAELGRRHGIPVMYDLGSGCLVDLSVWGLDPEPTVQETLQAGVDVVTFSGDKLLGGPQAGLIVGRRELLDRIRRNPLARALRMDKLTLAALRATLQLYWDPQEATRRIPTLGMLAVEESVLRSRARGLARRISKAAPAAARAQVRKDRSRVGGGALPLLALDTWVVAIRVEGVSAARLERGLREADPPVLARILKEEILLDLRTVQEDEIPTLARSVAHACTRSQEDPPWNPR